jgi:amino acid transporter/nucleotide-binding universal stress UspA family protein
MAVDNPQSAHLETELSRDLSLFHVTMMGVGMMIGAGVFIGMGNCLKAVGPGGTLMTFTLNALIAMCSAMSYAELSSAIPKAGGAYNFARIGFGRGPSFFAGWVEWCASSVAGSLYAMTFAIYVLNFLSQMGYLPWSHSATHFSVRILAAATALLFAYINYRGASETGKIGSLITVAQTVTLGLVALIGIVVAIKEPSRLQNFEPFLPAGWMPILMTMGFIYVAFEGFEVIAQAGDETIEPRKNLPKAMMLSVVVVAVTYLFVTIASVVSVKHLGGSWAAWIGADTNTMFARVVQQLLPFGGGILVVLAVIFSATSALNATTYSATRAVYALGRDRFLPGVVSKVSSKTKTPVTSLGMTATIIVSIVLFLPVEDVASSASIMFLFLFLMVNLCVIRIRRQMGDELEYGYVMPLFPLPPLLAITAQVLLAVELKGMSRIAWIVAPVWLAGGALVYFLYGKKHVVGTSDEIVTFTEAEPMPKEGYRILVPVANPDNALQLLTETMKIAQAKNAQVDLLHMVQIPDQVPLADAEKYMNIGKEAIAEAMLYLQSRFPIRDTVRYCRNVARGILSAAREHQADLIIAGWPGRKRKHDLFLLGRTIDPLLERNPCNVILLHNCNQRIYKRILVPFAGGPHSRFGLEIASAMIDPKDGVIVPFNVTSPGQATIDIESFLEKHAEQFHCRLDRFQPQHAVAKNALSTIADAAADADLTIIGATERPSIFRTMRHNQLLSIIEKRLHEKPLIMVKAGTPVESFLNRWV